MAKPQLQELFDWLQSNAGNRFEIYDVERNRTLEKCAGYDDLTSGGKSLEDYFIALADKGVGTVQIVKKRKNGSTFIREGCGLNYSLSTGANNNVAASGSPVLPGATPQQPQYAYGLGSPAGLSVPELLAERYRETQMTAEELKAELKKMQIENFRLDRKNLMLENDLKREKEKRQEDKEKEPSMANEIVKMLIANPSLIPQILGGVKGATTPGLNAPQQTTQESEELTPTQKLVIERIKKHPDQNVTGAYYILDQAEKNNVEFLQQYHNLLTQFNIIQDGSDSESDRV